MTLLVKPVLLPLLLVPILARRWTAVALSLGLSTIGVALAFPLARSGSAELVNVIGRLSQGSSLSGRSSRFNLSLWGLGQWRHLPDGLVLTARIGVAVIAIACIVAVWRSRPEMTLAIVGPLAGILLAATFLAGPLSEVHYLLLLMPLAFTCLLVKRNTVTGLLMAGWLLAAYSSKLAYGFGYNISAWQLRFVGIEVLVFVACALALLAAVRGGPVDDSTDQRWRSLARATLGPGDVRGDPQARP